MPVGASAARKQIRQIALTGCHQGLWTFPLKWAEWVSKAPQSGDMPSVTRAVFKLSDGTTLAIKEHPKIGKAVNFNSEIVVGEGNTFTLRNLIRGGESFRFVQAGSACGTPGSGALLLAFETAFTGQYEAFVLIRYSPRGIRVYGLPPARQARAVLRSGEDNHVEIWAAEEESAPPIDCDACPRYYSIQSCGLAHQKMRCKLLRKTRKPLSPYKFIGHRIKIVSTPATHRNAGKPTS